MGFFYVMKALYADIRGTKILFNYLQILILNLFLRSILKHLKILIQKSIPRLNI